MPAATLLLETEELQVPLVQLMEATAVQAVLAAMLTHLLKVAMAVPVAVQQVALQQVEASMRAQLVAMAVVPTTVVRTVALVERLLADLRSSQVVTAELVVVQQAVA